MNTISALPCDVITDLMVAYESGEASPATHRLVDDHLAGCAACRAAFGGGRPITERLSDEPVVPLTNGRAFVTRTRRTAFVILSALLMLFALACGVGLRVIIQQLDSQPLPGMPRIDSLWFVVTPLAFLGYCLALLPDDQKKGWLPFLRLLLLAGLGAGVFALFFTSSTQGASLGALLLVIALVLTCVRLPKLRYSTVIAVAVLLLLNLAMLAGITVNGAQAMLLGFTTGGPIGQPAAEMSAEEAVQPDLSAIGMELVDLQLDDAIQLSPPATQALQAARSQYSDSDQTVSLSTVQFASPQAAQTYFQDWKELNVGNLRLAYIEVNSTSPETGRFVRLYNPASSSARYAWQYDEWVTLVEAPGAVQATLGLVTQVKEAVIEHYGVSLP